VIMSLSSPTGILPGVGSGEAPMLDHCCACYWCDRPFQPRRTGGRAQRFCRMSCRWQFHATRRAAGHLMRFASANSWRCNDKADLWEISCVLRDPVQFAAVRAELSARIATGDAVDPENED
jgi:hypothetical protein